MRRLVFHSVFDDRPNEVTSTFTAVGAITYAFTNWFSLTTGLGKGFADTDNPSGTMQFANGDLGTGICFGIATLGLPQFERDSLGFSISYEYSITQKEASLSFDVSFGLSFSGQSLAGKKRSKMSFSTPS